MTSTGFWHLHKPLHHIWQEFLKYVFLKTLKTWPKKWVVNDLRFWPKIWRVLSEFLDLIFFVLVLCIRPYLRGPKKNSKDNSLHCSTAINVETYTYGKSFFVYFLGGWGFGFLKVQWKILKPRCELTSATSRQPQYSGICSELILDLIQIWHVSFTFPWACA